MLSAVFNSTFNTISVVSLCKLQKRVHSTPSRKVYQLISHGRWFSPASSTTKTGRHDIAEILLKVALNTINQIKSVVSWRSVLLVEYMRIFSINSVDRIYK